jgi:hypothetical protein
MQSSRTVPSISRRAAVAGLAGGAFAVASHKHTVASAQATPEMATHPIVGAWMVTTPAGLAMAVFAADGTNIQGLPATQAGPNGVAYVSTQIGTWEPVSERGVHFTGVQLHTDANGNLIGTVTIDAYPVVSDDGQTLRDDDPRSGPIIRDATGAVIADMRGSGPPATGVRMGPGFPGLLEGSPEPVTPVS